MTIHNALLVGAIVCFVLGTVGPIAGLEWNRIVAFGLALFSASFLL